MRHDGRASLKSSGSSTAHLLMQIAIGFESSLDQKIADAIEGRGPWALKLSQILVLRRLRDHRGRTMALPLRMLVAATNLNEREIKKMVQMFVLDFQIPVGAARSKPEGYYLATTAEERLEAARPYIHEIRKLAQRVKALIGTKVFLEEMGQMQLDEAAEAKQ